MNPTSSINILFTETQKFKQWWVWAIMIISVGTFVSYFYQLFIIEVNINSISPRDIGLLVLFITILGIFILLIVLKLEVSINHDGLIVRYFPFHLKNKFFKWEELDQCFVKEYKPFTEYGGWGLRGMGNDKAWNIAGNFGLQLIFKDGKKLLIGTQKPEELKSCLEKLGK